MLVAIDSDISFQVLGRFVSHAAVSGWHKSALDYYHSGHLRESQEILTVAMILTPDTAEIFHLSAVVAYAAKDFDLALRRNSRSIRLDPMNAAYHQNAGPIHRALRQFDDALAAIHISLLLAPGHAGNYNNLGTLLHVLGRYAEAVACFDRNRVIAGPDPVVEYNAGGVYCDCGKLEEAEQCLLRALALRATYAEAHNRLGKVRRLKGKLGEAGLSHKCAIVLAPEDPAPYTNLAAIHKLHAQSAKSIGLYCRSLRIRPGSAETFSNMLFAMQYSIENSSGEIAAAHRVYGDLFEAPLRPLWRPHSNSLSPERRLKVGYVSADFNFHATSHFLEPVLANHDAGNFEIYCYSNSMLRDFVTERMQAAVDHWVSCHSMSDEQLAQRIQDDCIDILVDLSGHTAGNRLLVFARKPAPVQVTWLGYFGSTGLTAMDYRLTDAHMDPPDRDAPQQAEKALRLPYFAPFQPIDRSPQINRLPALSTGNLTLASMNNVAKLNVQVVRLWSRILECLPGARLMLCNLGDAETGRLVSKLFADEGIGPERLLLKPWMPMLDYLALHHQIDLALDPFPYNGGATTNHSLWMGVPVVTLAGDRPVSRIGASLMNRAKLSQFVTCSEEDYLRCVLSAAEDLHRLNEIRQSLRERIAANPDASPSIGTHSVEHAYRVIWREWCNGKATKVG